MVLFGDFMFVFTVLLWTLIVALSTAARTELKDQPQVIGSHQPIVATLGDDVILPCLLEPKLNVQGLTVEWSKPDLKPDPSDRLSRVEYVHLYRGGQEDLDMKMQSYIRRTELFADAMKEGNVSLKIRNVTLADEGRYRCFIPKLNGPVKDAIVILVVEPKSVKTWTTETPSPEPKDETDVRGVRLTQSFWVSAVLVPVFLILVGGVSACLFKHKCQKPNLQKYDVAPASLLPV